ncbi:MAG: 7-cyano-7-deazaguanine synthase QueC [Candidatus Zhuqueibacterota bacterium]
MAEKAVVLLSGGVDSSTALAIARDRGFEVYAISFRYGQRHSFELIAAKKIATALGAKAQLIIDVSLDKIGGSSLTADIDVPKHRDMSETDEIPVTYVPARNTIFLSLALGWAESLGAYHIFIGATAVDYSGYPDCRPEFIRAFEQVANLGTKIGVQGGQIHIHAPLIHLSKAEIIRKGTQLGVDYSLTLSCYDPSPDGKACGACDSCLLRKKGFEEAGLPDPTRYIN